jgi:anti-sigma factor RsiW
MSAAPLTCQELVELITDYLEGSLSRADRRRFKGHIRACPHCTKYLEQIRETIEATGRLTGDAIAPDARDELLRAFRDWKTARA